MGAQVALRKPGYGCMFRDIFPGIPPPDRGRAVALRFPEGGRGMAEGRPPAASA